MNANNMNQLNLMLLNKLKQAMKETSNKAEEDMFEETGDFYSQGEPSMYERTGALGETPRTTSADSFLTKNGGEVSFDAYLDQTHKYTTGDEPDMSQVLDLANYGTPWITKEGSNARSTLGKKYFLERAEKKIEKSLKDTLRSYFK